MLKHLMEERSKEAEWSSLEFITTTVKEEREYKVLSFGTGNASEVVEAMFQ
jgi:hypothetical protein